MTEREYRQDDETRGYCPLCGRELSALTVTTQGFCEQHGWQPADWDSVSAERKRARAGISDDSGRLTDGGYENPRAYDKPGSAYAAEADDA